MLLWDAEDMEQSNRVGDPALIASRSGREMFNANNPAEARRHNMAPGAYQALNTIREGHIQYHQRPLRQSLEDGNDRCSD